MTVSEPGKQTGDRSIFPLMLRMANENIWGIFEVFNIYIEIMPFCLIYLQLVLVLNAYMGGMCMCVWEGKREGKGEIAGHRTKLQSK